jgi:hypothetical protein
VGVVVGWHDGRLDGCALGLFVGCLDGVVVGVLVGCSDGCPVGLPIGCALGCDVGSEDGPELGCPEGRPLGTLVGCDVGCTVALCPRSITQRKISRSIQALRYGIALGTFTPTGRMERKIVSMFSECTHSLDDASVPFESAFRSVEILQALQHNDVETVWLTIALP